MLYLLKLMVFILSLLFVHSGIIQAREQTRQARLQPTIKTSSKSQGSSKIKMTRKKTQNKLNNIDTPQEPAGTVDLHDLSELDISDILEPNSEYQYTFSAETSPFMFNLNPAIDDQIANLPVYTPTDVDVSKITIKGIWLLDNGQRKALIQEGDQRTTIVGVGYKIGEGRIVSIKKNEIIVGFHSMKSSGVREYKEKVIYFKK